MTFGEGRVFLTRPGEEPLEVGTVKDISYRCTGVDLARGPDKTVVVRNVEGKFEIVDAEVARLFLNNKLLDSHRDHKRTARTSYRAVQSFRRYVAAALRARGTSAGLAKKIVRQSLPRMWAVHQRARLALLPDPIDEAEELLKQRRTEDRQWFVCDPPWKER